VAPVCDSGEDFGLKVGSYEGKVFRLFGCFGCSNRTGPNITSGESGQSTIQNPQYMHLRSRVGLTG
jgi:hypothetical protein